MGLDISVPRKKVEANVSQSAPNSFSVAHEYEPNWGRSIYSQSEAGGYYAGRYGTLWGLLNKVKRQARAVVFREIGEEYTVPVGVWEVRENAVHCFDNKAETFAEIGEALKHLAGRLRVPIFEYLKKSQIIGQRKLSDF